MKVQTEVSTQERELNEVFIDSMKYGPPPVRRKNNRKSTKGRRNQYVTEQIPGTFPPKFKTKIIKHFN